MSQDPEIIHWFQLRPTPSAVANNDAAIKRSLRSEIRDPLWMLGRQWQMAEFAAEDAGSASLVTTEINSRKFNKIRLGNSANKIDIHENTPVEAIVECSNIFDSYMIKIEMGFQWLKLLKNINRPEFNILYHDFNFNAPQSGNLRLEMPTGISNYNKDIINSKIEYLELAIKKQIIDGTKLYKYLSNSSNKASNFLGSSDPQVDTLGDEFIEIYKKIYTLPVSDINSSWISERQEYKFSYSSETSNNTIEMIADEYYDGRFDWNDVNIKKTISGSSNNASNLKKTIGIKAIPTGVKFPGMPLKRLWAIEDTNTNIGNIDIFNYDSASLIFTEFCLMYSNDWSIIPVILDTGTFSEIKEISVVDVFGQVTKIKHFNDIDGNANDWSVFSVQNSNADSFENGLFFPNVVNNFLESESIETVIFARDEMANIVWGIEHIIPDLFGIGKKAHELAQKHTAKIEPDVNSDKQTYSLIRTTSPNWIPFIPQRDSTSNANMLQLAAIPYVNIDNAMVLTEPASTIIKDLNANQNIQKNKIFNEEIPRSGIIVSKKWKRSRGADGKIYTWLKKTKKVGRGETSSSLKFDFLR